MKRVRTSRPDPYRNDVVLRSAQRLIAVGTKKDLQRRRMRHFFHPSLRQVGIVGGLLLAIGVGFFLRGIWLESDRPTVEGRPSGSSTRLIWIPEFLRPTTAKGSRETKPQGFSAAAPSVFPSQIAPAPDSPVSSPSDSLIGRTVDGYNRTQSPNTSTVLQAGRLGDQRTEDVLLLVANTVVLRGKLYRDGALPVEMEFVLHRKGNSALVYGLVRFLENDIRLASYGVDGTTVDGAIVVRESTTIWTRSNPPPFGREYRIVPSTGATSSEFTGTWTLGETTGTLQLSIALPW